MLEAWATDVTGCFEEAVVALTSTYATFDPATLRAAPAVRLPPGPRVAQLLALLDEVVFALDTADGVPVRAQVRQQSDASLDVVLQLVPPDRVVPIGALPKAIARSELAVTETRGRVACRFLVDV